MTKTQPQGQESQPWQTTSEQQSAQIKDEEDQDSLELCKIF